jgi:hypothetical protein
MVPNPSEEHLQCSHRITECLQKSEDDRTFLRPDHLRQHVKNFHKSSLKDAVRDAWRRDGPGKEESENWTCGFCAQELETWDARETHITGHFKDGLTMADWKVHGKLNGMVEESRKRPTSSEGQPSVFAKLARTFTGKSIRQQQHAQPLGQFSESFESLPIYASEMSVPVAPLLPDLVFDSFMAEVCGDTFDYNCSSLTGMSLGEQNDAEGTRYDSAVPGDESLGSDFDALAGVYLSEDLSDLTGLWFQ